MLIEKQQQGRLTETEQRSLDYYKAQIADLDSKFNERMSRFYIEENMLSQEDINYYNRYDNDY